MAAYLTEAFSNRIKKAKLDFGAFNRLILEEGGEIDLELRGEKAYGISIGHTFPGFESFQSPVEIHSYFSKKYLEGLTKFDEQFGCNAADLIKESLAEDFKKGPFYEKKLASRGSSKVMGRWFSDEYQVVLSTEKGHENVIYRCAPDPFVIDFDVKKVTLADSEVIISSKLREETACHQLASSM